MPDPEAISLLSSDDDNGENASSDDDSDDGHVLLDLEADDSGDTESEGSGSDTDGHEGLYENEASSAAFHPFVRLPPELRRRVWELYCPDLACTPRVLNFTVSPSSARHAHLYSELRGPRELWTVKDGLLLEQQTSALRRLLAVNSESRAIALHAYPDTLAMDVTADTIVRFHKERDVVALLDCGSSWRNRRYHFPGFAEMPTQLAVSMIHGADEDDPGSSLRKWFRMFKNVKRAFFAAPNDNFTTRAIAWCATEHAYQYTTPRRLSRNGHGYRSDFPEMYCWPNVDEHQDFANFQIGPRLLDLSGVHKVVMIMLGIRSFPMLTFRFDSQFLRYENLQKTLQNDPNFLLEELSDDGSSAFSDPSSDSNHYESEGIDDSHLLTQEESSEDELVPIIIADSDSSDVDASQEDDGLGPGARFSSPELESPGSPENDSETPSRALTKRPKRRIVSDSDDEDQHDGEPTAKRARTARVVLSDSEDDEDGGVSHRAVPEPHVVISDSDSDADEDARIPKRSVRKGGSTGDEGDSDESDSAPPARLSLAERLQQYRDENPIPVSDDDSVSRDEDGNSLMANTDDGEDEEEEEDSEDGLIDGMAGDSEGEGEDGTEDEW